MKTNCRMVQNALVRLHIGGPSSIVYVKSVSKWLSEWSVVSSYGFGHYSPLEQLRGRVRSSFHFSLQWVSGLSYICTVPVLFIAPTFLPFPAAVWWSFTIAFSMSPVCSSLHHHLWPKKNQDFNSLSALHHYA